MPTDRGILLQGYCCTYLIPQISGNCTCAGVETIVFPKLVVGVSVSSQSTSIVSMEAISQLQTKLLCLLILSASCPHDLINYYFILPWANCYNLLHPSSITWCLITIMYTHIQFKHQNLCSVISPGLSSNSYQQWLAYFDGMTICCVTAYDYSGIRQRRSLIPMYICIQYTTCVPVPMCT